ncbi:MAG TPA: tripartite tricarboxylate transporter substrate binding protein [Burkholderiales bacterium]|nr:tripartite tricarboxylate transporter substrate binding protein [Burkholderiales bacterium]
MVRCPRVILAVAALAAATAAAQQYPSRPVRFVVPFPPGGTADYVARMVAPGLTQSLGQQVLVDNRPGGDGAVAGQIVTKSAPDGHTIFFGTNSPMSAVPALHRKPPYDSLADFTPVGLIGRFTFFLFVPASLPAKTLKELIDYAKANPGKLNYGTGNTTAIVASAQFKSLAGIDVQHIPYKGDAPTTADMLGGTVHMAFMTLVPGFAQVKEGRLRVLAVLLPKRSAVAPDVPTIAEAGMPGVSLTPWAGLFGPAKLPPRIVERLSHDLSAVLSRADIREQLGRQGFEVQSSTAAEMDRYNREQLAAWKRVILEAKIPME